MKSYIDEPNYSVEDEEPFFPKVSDNALRLLSKIILNNIRKGGDDE